MSPIARRRIVKPLQAQGRPSPGFSRQYNTPMPTILFDIDGTPANQTALQDAYLAHLPHSLTRRGGEVCPGVRPLIASLRGTMPLGLLTGNVRAGARHKLGHFGLWDHFAFGGFGDDHFDR